MYRAIEFSIWMSIKVKQVCLGNIIRILKFHQMRIVIMSTFYATVSQVF